MFICEYCKIELLVKTRNILSGRGQNGTVEKIEAVCDSQKCSQYLVKKFFLWDGSKILPAV